MQANDDAGIEEVEQLLDLLAHDRPEARQHASEALLGLDADVVVPALARRLDLHRFGPRDPYHRVLRRIGEDAALPLARMLDDEDQEARCHAARGLELLGHDAHPAARRIAAALRDAEEDRYVVLRLVRAARYVVPEALVLAMAERLRISREDAGLSVWCAFHVGSLGRHGLEAVPALRELLLHDETRVVRAARQAIRRITSASR